MSSSSPRSAQRPRTAALSPSRANDFVQCPLLFRLRTIDRIPEPPSSAATRGTLVHAVLERLFDIPLGHRTIDKAHELLPQEWSKLQDHNPDVTSLFDSDDDEHAWLTAAQRLLRTYFSMEDPNRLEPKDREVFIESRLENGPLLRGIVDRIDIAPSGDIRIVDYKTGKSPRPGYDTAALFQMRFYALLLWRERGVVPRMLQLIYLGDGKVLRAEPTPQDLQLTEDHIRLLWEQIATAAETGVWPAKRSALCGWCAHQVLCPAFGGTPPEYERNLGKQVLGITASPA